MMTDKEARNLIEQDLREKLLGPGYAKDIIICSDDCLDEIIPDSPRNAYRVGIITPASHKERSSQETDDSPDEDIAIQESEQYAINTFDIDDNDDEQAKKLHENIGEPDDNEITSGLINNNPMSSHIGLITCVPSKREKIEVEISYGTYEALSWKEKVEKVKVKSGKFTNSIIEAIDEFEKDEKTKESLQDLSLNSIKDIIIIDENAKTISLSPNVTNEISKIFLPKTSKFTVEAELIKILFSKCFKRIHHTLTISNVTCDYSNQIVNDDDNVQVHIDSYETNNKRFISVILKSVSNQYIYQPCVSVKGNLLSYTEPISSIEDDKENAINEFLYRNVKNYGKGINCAVKWDEDAKRIFTTFTPTVDVEKFTNKQKTGSGEDPVAKACTLRNLSIWSEDNIIIALLRDFVNGYDAWHKAQCAEGEKIEGYNSEKTTIIHNQEMLLSRLNKNVDYLEANKEALECFKIANTAMLMQMVVARHPYFKKNRDAAASFAEEPDFYDNLEFFSDSKYIGQFDNKNFEEPSYYPFQLAFLLMNVQSTFDMTDPDRRLVDLIWFPTGGGKTEAYLALTALTIVARRRRGQEKGVSVIMRYTLRLLTTQQFERATYLICALEFLRMKDTNLELGNDPISIGLYVGSGVTPNTTNELTNNRGKYRNFFVDGDLTTRRNNNPFPITYCPWCGSRLVRPDGNHGYQNEGTILCVNQRCRFKKGLPLSYIDEKIYNNQPTLLFATVDKFAQLYSGTHAKLLRPDGEVQTPDLIIQDELHLLVGALGSIVGFYESIIEKLCSKGERFPKIIAATATTRNTSELIRKLYNRDAAVFPPQGLDYSDNYFSHVEKSDSKRRHMGLISAECVSSNMTEIRLTSLLILSKIKVFKKYVEEMGLDWLNPADVKQACDQNGVLAKELDNYWSTVLYFNSLKDLGRSRSRVSQEIFEGVRSHQYLYTIPNSLSFLRPEKGFDQRVLEFTSRIDSSRIKSMLTQAETRVQMKDDHGWLKISDYAIDLVFASNMISVGIDIARWNLLVMVGQPRSTSEYIQSSSRAARSTYGLVVNLMNPRRVRERSLFENYVPFHRTFYKGVEPLSITPLTSATMKHKVLVNIAVIYKKKFMPNETDKAKIAKTIINELFANRYGLQRGQLVDNLLKEITSVVDQILNAQQIEAAQSLREIASDSYISIKDINYPI